MKFFKCCRNCKKRTIYCHGSCEDYLAEKTECARVKAIEFEIKEQDRQFYKHRRNRKRDER